MIGYDVKFGNDTEYHRYETTDTSLSLSGDFLKFVEQYAPKSIQIQKQNSQEVSYVTKIKVKPVFDYKDVRIEINQSEYGTFDDANLKQTTTDVFHVGDVIKLSATAYSKYKDYEYESYESFARVYDELMDNVPYDEWAEFYISKLKEYGIEKNTKIELNEKEDP